MDLNSCFKFKIPNAILNQGGEFYTIVEYLSINSFIQTYKYKISANMAQPYDGVSEEDFTNFIEAIKTGSLQQTEGILRASSQAIVNKLEIQLRQPALYFAALVEGDQITLELFKLLIRHGANYRFKDHNEQTILFYVCRQGKEKCVELLLSYGLSLDEVDMYGQTPMFYAINENKIEIVRKYATKQRVNHVDNLAGQTPLYYAARRGHIQLCRILIEKGAEISHVDNNGKTAVQYAKKAKYIDVAELLNSELRRTKEVNKHSVQSYSIQESNLDKKKKKEESQKILRQTYKIVFLNEKGEPHDLTEEEVRLLIKQKPDLQAYLCNPEAIPSELIENSNNDNWEKVALKVLTQSCKLKGSYWFSEAVDPVKFNIMDYFDIISKPMDLGTIRKKLSHNCYTSPIEFVEDMNLVWLNCFKYNGQTHDISRCAKQLQVGFNEYYVTCGLDKFIQNK